MLNKKTCLIVFLFIFLSGIFFVNTALAGPEIYIFKDDGATYFTNTPGQGRIKVKLPLKKFREKIYFPFVDQSGSGYQSLISEASQQVDLDPHLVMAVIKAESNFNPLAVSPKGAMGLMQLMPATAKEMGVDNPFDPAENIRGGMKYLSRMLNLFNQDVSLALAAYNAGPLRVMEHKGIPAITETRNYIQQVLNYYKTQKL